MSANDYIFIGFITGSFTFGWLLPALDRWINKRMNKDGGVK